MVFLWLVGTATWLGAAYTLTLLGMTTVADQKKFQLGVTYMALAAGVFFVPLLVYAWLHG